MPGPIAQVHRMGGLMVNKTLEGPQKIPGRSSGRIQTVTSSTFNPLVLEGEGPIVVEFMSYGCAHCRVLEPVLQQVAEMVKSKEKISGLILRSSRNSQIAGRSGARQL